MNDLDRASYSSKITVEFIEAVGLWAKESLLKCLHQASCFSLMADVCTDVTTIMFKSYISIFCHWVEDGVYNNIPHNIPVEHFLEIVPSKSADAKTIYSTLVEFLKEKNIQISKLVGMGFDGAATFFEKRKGV